MNQVPICHTSDDSLATIAQDDAAMAEFLVRMARPGSLLRIAGAQGVVVTARERAVGKVRGRREVPAAVIEAARRAGYLLTVHGGAGSPATVPVEVLSQHGLDAMRQILTTAQRTTHNPRSATPKVKNDSSREPMMSARTVERLSLLERLSRRQDADGRPLLDHVQVQAGLRFAQDFLTAGLQQRVTARWSTDALPSQGRRGAPGSGADLALVTSAAQARVRSAMASMSGALADLVLDVCCYDRGLEAIEKERHWPPRTARIVLALGLDELARHYGMIATGTRRTGRINHWGEGGYRPTAQNSTSPVE